MAEAATVMNGKEVFPIEFSIERGPLLKSLSRLQAIVEKRNSLPVLANIKVEVTDGQVAFTSTDLELVVNESLPAEVRQQGVLTIPAQTFYDIVRKVPEGAEVRISTDLASSQVIVDAGAAHFQLSFLPADDFPVLAEGEYENEFTLPAASLLALVEKAKFAMSSEETRYYLNGVYFHAFSDEESGSEMLRTVATDGHRLARVEAALPAGASGMTGVIIPRKAINEISKIIDASSEDVKVSVSDAKIKFHSGAIVLLSKLVDGTFPDYASAIPSGNTRKLEVETKLLYQSIDRVSSISTDKTRGIKLSLSSGKLGLLVQSPEAGKAEEEIEVLYDAEPLEIGFNSRYMLEMISQLEGDTVQFLFSDTNAPALVTDPSDIGGFYVLMPMRV